MLLTAPRSAALALVAILSLMVTGPIKAPGATTRVLNVLGLLTLGQLIELLAVQEAVAWARRPVPASVEMDVITHRAVREVAV